MQASLSSASLLLRLWIWVVWYVDPDISTFFCYWQIFHLLIPDSCILVQTWGGDRVEGRGQEKPFIYSLSTQPYEVPINFTTSLHFCPVFLLFSWQELPNSTYSLSTGPDSGAHSATKKGKCKAFCHMPFFFLLSLFYWKIIALQYFVGFFHTST